MRVRQYRPYVVDRENGDSATRKFVVSFLEAYSRSESDSPSTWDRLMNKVQVSNSNPYKFSATPTLKQVIGRAGRMASGSNPDEYLWCVLADISKACKTLDPLTRFSLMYRFVYGFHDVTSMQLVEVSSERQFGRIIDAGIDQIVELLDYR